ncbi:MAG: hypothetical protein VX762_01875 [Bacteroidota bacterium]|nr:hypothetical protein [Bacteroidota bacterium]
MKAPRIPSFFKSSSSKSFSFNPRYYNERKERREQWEKGRKANIRFNREHTKMKQKGRSMRIVFLIIILSLLAYKFIIN